MLFFSGRGREEGEINGEEGAYERYYNKTVSLISEKRPRSSRSMPLKHRPHGRMKT